MNPFLKKLLYVIGLLVCIAGGIMYLLQVGEAVEARGVWFDDAYMYIRYAQNIVDGYGYCWNNNTLPVYGCTDIPYTYLLSLGNRITSLSFEKIAVWLPVINMGLLLLVLPYTLIRASQPTSTSFKIFVFALCMSTLMFQPNILYHLFTGMDTVLALTANVFLIYSLFVLEKKKGLVSAIAAAFAVYFSYLIRPDNFFYVTVFPFLFFVFKLWNERKLIFTFTCCYILLFAIDMILKYYFFHDFLPLPFYIKSNGYFQGYMGEADWNPVEYVFVFLQYSFIWLLLAVVCFSKKQRHTIFVFFPPILLTFVYFFDNVQIMGTAARYYLPSLPFVVFPAVVMLSDKWKTGTVASSLFNKSSLYRSAVMFFLLAIMLQFSAQASLWYAEKFLQNRTAFEFDSKLYYEKVFPVYLTEYPNFFDFVKKLPTNTVIAAGENGKLAALNPHVRIIDLNGLHEPHFAYNGFSADWLLKKPPAIIQLTHYNITKINYDIITNSEFRKLYDFYPNLFGFGIGVLKSNHEVSGMFNQEVRTLYGISKPESYNAHFLSDHTN